MTNVRLGIAFVAGCALLLGGCSMGGGQQASTGPRFPARPAQVALDKLYPCTFLGPAQRAQLQLSRGVPTSPTVNGVPGTGCVWSGHASSGYTAQTIRIGAEVATAEPQASIIVVGGFGAVRSVVRDPLMGGAPACQVTVDVAPGGSVRVQAVGGDDPRPSDEEMCRLATSATEMMVRTIVATGR